MIMMMIRKKKDWGKCKRGRGKERYVDRYKSKQSKAKHFWLTTPLGAVKYDKAASLSKRRWELLRLRLLLSDTRTFSSTSVLLEE